MSSIIVWTVLFYVCIVGLVAAALSISHTELTRADFADRETRCVRSLADHQDVGGNPLHVRFC